jgi:competence protein ComEA
VNINTADAQTLAKELNGIGLAKAQAIVADRKRNGMFQTAADLARVKGVGDRLVVLNKDNIRLSEPSP